MLAQTMLMMMMMFLFGHNNVDDDELVIMMSVRLIGVVTIMVMRLARLMAWAF